MEVGTSDRGAAQLELAPLTYQIVTSLYSGPRATLYRALRREDGTRVVLKTPRHRRATPRDVADLAHEYAVLARLQERGW